MIYSRYEFRYEWEKRTEKFWMWIAWHLPHTLVMWCAVRVGVEATTGKWSHGIVPEVTFMDALNRWTYPNLQPFDGKHEPVNAP